MAVADRSIWQAGITALLLVLAAGPWFISYVQKLRLGQLVRSDGPAAHLAKEGTPTMGGLLILAAIFAATLLSGPRAALLYVLLMGTASYGFIGFLDDYRKITQNQSLGLRAREKLAFQIAVGLLLSAAGWYWAPGAADWRLPLGLGVWQLQIWQFIPAATFVVVGTANAVNLTDGLDGLAAGCTAAAAVFFTLVLLALGLGNLAVFSLALAGACLGFLWFNSHPAAIFMGDAGSLALGCALAALSIFSGTVFFLPIIGIVFVIETVSVILQVLYFRLTKGRRLFAMAPLHHHFELKGWAEPKIVVRFWLLTVLAGLVALFWW